MLGQIQEAIDECASQLVTYAEGNDLQRENFIQNIHKNKRILKLQVLSSRLIPRSPVTPIPDSVKDLGHCAWCRP